MRTVKMRGYDTQYNKWAYFTLDHFISGDVTDIAQRCRWWCESTGLHDRNGVEIYEGDIVGIRDKRMGEAVELNHRYENIYTVSFDDGCFNAPLGENIFDVIGNIYENPDLLSAPPQSKGSKG